MNRCILTAVLCALCFGAQAQHKRDTTWVVTDKGAWNIHYKVRPKETVFMLARRYHVPPAMLAEANSLTYDSKLKDGMELTIPLGAFNQRAAKPVNPAESRALYYHVQAADDVYQLSRKAGVPQRTLQSWNMMGDNEASDGQVLLVGWVAFDPMAVPVKDTAKGKYVFNPKDTMHVKPMASMPTTIVKRDTVRRTNSAIGNAQRQADSMLHASLTHSNNDTAHAVNTLEELYLQQTAAETNVVSEKGTAAFFNSSAGNANGTIYAFSNTAPKGNVVRVFNPGNGKGVYVKILGPLPSTAQYYNAIIGISSLAKKALGVTDSKMWCELSYAGY